MRLNLIMSFTENKEFTVSSIIFGIMLEWNSPKRYQTFQYQKATEGGTTTDVHAGWISPHSCFLNIRLFLDKCNFHQSSTINRLICSNGMYLASTGGRCTSPFEFIGAHKIDAPITNKYTKGTSGYILLDVCTKSVDFQSLVYTATNCDSQSANSAFL